MFLSLFSGSISLIEIREITDSGLFIPPLHDLCSSIGVEGWKDREQRESFQGEEKVFPLAATTPKVDK